MSFVRPLALSLVLAVASGCAGGPDAEALQKGVESAISAKDYAGAVTKADAALKEESIAKDPAKAWRFESMRLQALAEGGKGADVVSALERLATPYPKQVTAALYRSLADKVRGAGDNTGAIDVLAAGDKRFPDDPSFKAEIDKLKANANLDPAEVEKLKALGYL